MENKKNLMITMMHWECGEAQELLKSHGIESTTHNVMMAETKQPLHLCGAAKLMISEADYDKGLQIITKKGYKSDKMFIDGTHFEFQEF